MISNPHDGLFKRTFGQIEHARGALASIVSPGLAEALDWSALTLEPGSFVDAALGHQHTDLLYSLTWRSGSDAPVYVVFEHQSTAPTEARMGERLLGYQSRIWQRWRADHRKAKTVPMILPVVLYHGAAAWSEPVAFEDLIDVPSRLRPGIDPHLVRFTYVLHDLTQTSDDVLRAGAWTAFGRLVAVCFKYGRTEADLLRTLTRWVDVVREVASLPNGRDALVLLMRYVVEVNERITLDNLQRFLERELGTQAKEIVMTVGQQLIEQGLQQGRQEGRQEGIEQGRRQASQALFLRLIRQRFGAEVTPAVEQRVAAASFEEIEAWSTRMLSAATLAELMSH